MSRSRGSRSGSRRDWKEIVKKIAVITWKVIKFTITKIFPIVLKIVWFVTKALLAFAWIWFAVAWSCIVLLVDPKEATPCFMNAIDIIYILNGETT